ncbi:MAG: hypothetical protein HY077_03375 [Elusimicrobia bacterium]|nr:hypothetical protein [Elusimicrobiota bacterium]
MPTTSEVPEIKLSKVGDDRKRRKGGGVALPGAGGTGSSGFSGAVGGTVARAGARGAFTMLEGVFGKGMAALLPKILTVAMVSCLGYGAFAVGQALKAAQNHKPVAAKPKAFASKPAPEVRSDGGSADLMRTQGTQDSLRMVGGGLYGDASATQAAAQAATDAKAKSDAASATPPEQPNAPAAPAGMDPAAMAAAAAKAAGGGDKDGKDAKKDAKGFGAFSSQLGGGSSGGAGLTGFGIGQKMEGAGKLGGLDRFAIARGETRATSPLGRVVNPGLGRARRQLGTAAQLSQAATRSRVNETASQNALNAFQSPMGGDSAITGGGAGTSGAGSGGASGAASTNPGGGGGGGQSNPSLGGGGNGMDMCDAIFPDGGYINSSAGGCVCPPGQDSNGGSCAAVAHKNAAPWQGMSDIAKWLLLIAGALLMLAFIIGLLAKSSTVIPLIGGTWYALAKYMCYLAMILAGIATLIGISMAIMGGQAQTLGIVYTISGAITTFCAYKAADGFEPKSPTEVSNSAVTQSQDGLTRTATNGNGDITGQWTRTSTTSPWTATPNVATPPPVTPPAGTVPPASGGANGGAWWGLGGGVSGIGGGGYGFH